MPARAQQQQRCCLHFRALLQWQQRRPVGMMQQLAGLQPQQQIQLPLQYSMHSCLV